MMTRRPRCRANRARLIWDVASRGRVSSRRNSGRADDSARSTSRASRSHACLALSPHLRRLDRGRLHASATGRGDRGELRTQGSKIGKDGARCCRARARWRGSMRSEDQVKPRDSTCRRAAHSIHVKHVKARCPRVIPESFWWEWTSAGRPAHATRAVRRQAGTVASAR